MAKPRRRPVEDLETRERILSSAAALFAEQGYAAASISKIAQHAGVLPGSIYWAFESKEAILAAVIERAGQEWDERFLPGVEIGSFSEGDLRKSFAVLAAGFRDTPEFLRLIIVVASERQAGDPQVLEAARDIRRRGRQRIETSLARALDAHEPEAVQGLAQRIARQAIQLLDGAFLSLQLEPDLVTVETLFDEAAMLLAREIQHGVEGLPRRASREGAAP